MDTPKVNDFEELNRILNASEKTVFFGGAGVSTESGIPDFRSKDGLYNQHDVRFDQYEPEYLLSRNCLYNHPKVFFEFYRQKLDVRNVQPNAAHYKLAEMEAKGKLRAVITQNIDGLHQKTGSKTVIEIHGTTMANYCTECDEFVDKDFIFNTDEPIPRCPHCGKGIIRPNVTLYGEQLPWDAVDRAIRLIEEADTLIIGGTSLVVQPAAGFVNYFSGKNLIIMNMQPTPQDKYSQLLFTEPIGQVMSKIVIK